MKKTAFVLAACLGLWGDSAFALGDLPLHVASPATVTDVPAGQAASPATGATATVALPLVAPLQPASSLEATPILPVAVQTLTWNIRAGDSLDATLEIWSKRAGWELDWDVGDDFVAMAGASFSGTFEEAITQLFASFTGDADLNAYVTANHLLYVKKGYKN